RGLADPRRRRPRRQLPARPPRHPRRSGDRPADRMSLPEDSSRAGRSAPEALALSREVEGESLVDLLARRGRDKAGSLAFTFLADGERETERLTYGELVREARRIGA